jgi:hypothetical protein
MSVPQANHDAGTPNRQDVTGMKSLLHQAFGGEL